MDELYMFDAAYYQNGCVRLCGVDEAGRGPLAGPVFAAAVVLGPDFVLEGINDSKKLTELKRERLFDEITGGAADYAISYASEAEIDELNILQATFLAMQRAVLLLSATPKLVLIDGNRAPCMDIPTECVIQGDAKSASIAAASILAKVARDRYMVNLGEKYPQYRFCQHKGYPTKLHYELLREHGVSPVHRLSFLKKLSLENAGA